MLGGVRGDQGRGSDRRDRTPDWSRPLGWTFTHRHRGDPPLPDFGLPRLGGPPLQPVSRRDHGLHFTPTSVSCGVPLLKFLSRRDPLRSRPHLRDSHASTGSFPRSTSFLCQSSTSGSLSTRRGPSERVYVRCPWSLYVSQDPLRPPSYLPRSESTSGAPGPCASPRTLPDLPPTSRPAPTERPPSPPHTTPDGTTIDKWVTGTPSRGP